MVLDVVVCPGRQHSAAHARPGLCDVLDRLPKQQLPALVRGDCGFPPQRQRPVAGDPGFGNEPFIAELEKRGQPYLFKLRQTSGVKKMLMRQFSRKDWSMPGPSDQGWSAVEDTLRRAAKSDVALTRKAAEGQMELLLPDEDVELWEYAVLVTNSSYPLESIPPTDEDLSVGAPSMAQLYRDRADAENGFDELKNQWGWGGFTTQDIERCQTSARAGRWFTTGGAGTAARPSPRPGWRPSPAGRCCWPPWAERPGTLEKRRSI
jgi:hypothetical protein